MIPPIISWTGNKGRLLPSILEIIPQEINHFYDLFTGSGVVGININANNIHLNDYNYEIINMLNIIKDAPDILIKHLKTHNTNSGEYYYNIRNMDRDDRYINLTPIEKASRFIYLVATGFNGLYRVNRKGFNNTAYRKRPVKDICKSDIIHQIHHFFNTNNVIVTNNNYMDVDIINDNTFVYLDPPYYPLSTTSSFTSYSTYIWDKKAHIDLKLFCDKLHLKNIKFLMSNSSCPEIYELYKDYGITNVEVYRHISSNPSKRKSIQEVFIKNY